MQQHIDYHINLLLEGFLQKQLTLRLSISFSTIYLGLSLIFLGIASYAWWGSQRQLAWDLDHYFMEIHILGLSLVILSSIY